MNWHLLEHIHKLFLRVFHNLKKIEHVRVEVVKEIMIGFWLIKKHSAASKKRLNVCMMLRKVLLNILSNLALISYAPQYHPSLIIFTQSSGDETSNRNPFHSFLFLSISNTKFFPANPARIIPALGSRIVVAPASCKATRYGLYLLVSVTVNIFLVSFSLSASIASGRLEPANLPMR